MGDIWTNLPEGRGTLVACNAEYAAAAELNRVTVWRGESHFAVIESEARAPCRPYFSEQMMFWGDHILDLQTGATRTLPNIAAALIEGTGLPAGPSPAGEYIPAVFAWSSRTDSLVVSANWAGVPGPVMGRLILVDQNGDFRKVLSEKNEAAPTAVWAGRNIMAAGWRDVELLGYDGALLGGFNAKTPPARLESTLDEKRLLVVEYGQLFIVDIDSQSIIGSTTGNFLDAAIDPAGEFVMVLTLSGSVQILAIDPVMSIQKTYDHPDLMRGLHTGNQRVVASFSSGNPVRIAALDDIF